MVVLFFFYFLRKLHLQQSHCAWCTHVHECTNIHTHTHTHYQSCVRTLTCCFVEMEWGVLNKKIKMTMAVFLLIQLCFYRHLYRLWSIFYKLFIVQVVQASQCIQKVISESLGSVYALWQQYNNALTLKRKCTFEYLSILELCTLSTTGKGWH